MAATIVMLSSCAAPGPSGDAGQEPSAAVQRTTLAILHTLGNEQSASPESVKESYGSYARVLRDLVRYVNTLDTLSGETDSHWARFIDPMAEDDAAYLRRPELAIENARALRATINTGISQLTPVSHQLYVGIQADMENARISRRYGQALLDALQPMERRFLQLVANEDHAAASAITYYETLKSLQADRAVVVEDGALSFRDERAEAALKPAGTAYHAALRTVLSVGGAPSPGRLNGSGPT